MSKYIFLFFCTSPIVAQADILCIYDLDLKYGKPSRYHFEGLGRNETDAAKELERDCLSKMGDRDWFSCKTFRMGSTCSRK